MLRSLDFLGLMKWPNLLAVTAVPAVSFAFWGGFDDPKPRRSYGEARAGAVAFELVHPASDDPRSGETHWCIQPGPEARFAHAEIAYGSSTPPEQGWAAMSQDGQSLCAALPPAPGVSDRLWIRLVSKSGAEAVASWPLTPRARTPRG